MARRAHLRRCVPDDADDEAGDAKVNIANICINIESAAWKMGNTGEDGLTTHTMRPTALKTRASTLWGPRA
jgi:hypothetical protein